MRKVFLHGAGMDHSVWRSQTERFDDAVAIDLPGHGDSTEAPLGSIAEQADWVASRIGAMATGAVAVVGHSMGSLIALTTAAEHPDLVDRLALVGTATRMAVSPGLLTAAGTGDREAVELAMKWGFRSGVGSPKPWVKAVATTLMRSVASGVLASDLNACDRFSDAVTMAGRVRCPTLLLLGEHDVMTPPRAAARLAAVLADARVVIIPHAGHMLMLEQPQAVNDALAQFLQSPPCATP